MYLKKYVKVRFKFCKGSEEIQYTESESVSPVAVPPCKVWKDIKPVLEDIGI